MNFRVAGLLKAFLILGSIFLCASPVWAEDVTVTTFYPSPEGDYSTLSVANQLTINNTATVNGLLSANGGLLLAPQDDAPNDPQDGWMWVER